MDNKENIIPANEMQFEQLCLLLEELFNINNSNKKNKKDEQFKVLTNFVNDFKVNAAKINNSKVIFY